MANARDIAGNTEEETIRRPSPRTAQHTHTHTDPLVLWLLVGVVAHPVGEVAEARVDAGVVAVAVADAPRRHTGDLAVAADRTAAVSTAGAAWRVEEADVSAVNAGPADGAPALQAFT